MTDYTHCTVQQLRAKWTEVINWPIPPIRRSLIIKYLIWYEQAKREKISFLGFLMSLNRLLCRSINTLLSWKPDLKSRVLIRELSIQ